MMYFRNGGTIYCPLKRGLKDVPPACDPKPPTERGDFIGAGVDYKGFTGGQRTLNQ
jgi:hypothetical protein